MHYQVSKTTLFKINYTQTLQNIKKFIDKLPMQEHNGKFRRAIKGNVNATAVHIYRLFMGGLKKNNRIVKQLRTTNTSLAKISNNCARTIQRHIAKLIELEILVGKVHAGNGLKLLLNEALLAFDGKEVAAKPTEGKKEAPIALNGQNIAEFTQNLLAKFSIKTARPA